MRVKELIKLLKKCNQNSKVLISSDEELNTLFTRFELSKYLDYDTETEKEVDNNEIVIFGFSGSEKR